MSTGRDTSSCSLELGGASLWNPSRQEEGRRGSWERELRLAAVVCAPDAPVPLVYREDIPSVAFVHRWGEGVVELWSWLQLPKKNRFQAAAAA